MEFKSKKYQCYKQMQSTRTTQQCKIPFSLIQRSKFLVLYNSKIIKIHNLKKIQMNSFIEIYELVFY